MSRAGREHEHAFALFGTHVRLLIGPHASEAVDPRLSALRVQARLQRMHRTLTRFDRESELSQLNARAGEAVTVSPVLFDAVAAAVAAAAHTDGLVDPTILPALERAGYASSRAGAVPADLRAAVAAAPPRRAARPHDAGRWRAIELDADARTVRLPAGVRIDLGGTAKGLAADLAAAMLAGHRTFAVDAGGDLRLGGTDPAARAVLVEDPFGDEVAHAFTVAAGAIATSGLRTRVWRTGAGFAHHLIDPSTGRPAWTGVVQATALAPTALEAETLAKTALLRGPEAGLRLLAPGGGALVLDDGRLVHAGLPDPATRAAAAAAPVPA